VSYDAAAMAPETSIRTICRFLGLGWDPALAAHIDGRALARRDPLKLDPRIREWCVSLAEQLDGAASAAAARLGTEP